MKNADQINGRQRQRSRNPKPSIWVQSPYRRLFYCQACFQKEQGDTPTIRCRPVLYTNLDSDGVNGHKLYSNLKGELQAKKGADNETIS